MSQINNDYLIEQLANQGFTFGEEIALFAGAGTTAVTGYPVKDQCHHVTTCSVASAALVLKSIMSNDNPGMVFIVNDSANTIVVFPFKASAAGAVDNVELINGATGGFAITSLNSAIFTASLVQQKRKGGAGGTTPELNWSAALLQ